MMRSDPPPLPPAQAPPAPADAAPGVPAPPLRRLHPASLIISLALQARRLLIPALAVLLFAGGERRQLAFAILFIPAVAYEVFHYLTLRYRITGQGIIVRQGLFFRSERDIPFERIQNIDVVQGPLQRLLKVAEVRLETAGGAKPEAVFRVLSLQALEEMRRWVFASRAAASAEHDGQPAPGVPAQPQPRLLLRLGPGDLAMLGLRSNRGVALLAVAIGMVFEYDLLNRFGPGLWKRLSSASAAQLADPILFVLLVAGAVLVLKLLSVIWIVLWFHGYRLERLGDDLRISAGLLTKRAATVPRHRVQLVSIQQTPVHQLLGQASIRIETAGGARSDEEGDESAQLSRKWFVPIVSLGKLPALLPELLPGLALHDLQWQPLAPTAPRRILFRSILGALLLSALAALLFRPWGGVSGAAFIPLALWQARRAARFIAYAITPVGVAFRSGAWIRRTSLTFWDRMQVLSISQTPFDRRHGHASLIVDTAGAGPAEHSVRIPYLPLMRAIELQRQFTRAALSPDRRNTAVLSVRAP